MSIKAFICGCEGTQLNADEREFLYSYKPAGLILFSRNVESKEQLKRLCADFRKAVGRLDAPVLVDQEGGRVQRLKPPVWEKYPPAGLYGKLFEYDQDLAKRGAFLGAYLIGRDLAEVGISMNCLPVLDVPIKGASNVIGDRAYSDLPETISTLGNEVIRGSLAAGITPVMKHMPGHGKALVDSHEHLPIVEATRSELEKSDFIPFTRLNNCPFAMTAHIVYKSLDSERPATQSKTIISEVIRGYLGFEGCLMSDDVSMKALGSNMKDRVGKLFDAGCDLALHCNGNMGEMQAVAEASPELTGQSLQRFQAGIKSDNSTPAMELDVLFNEYNNILSVAKSYSS